MSALTLRAGAHQLIGAADQLAVASSTLGGRAVSQAVRTEASESMLDGAIAVRSMGGPFFERMSDAIIAQAARVHDGRPVQPAIDAAMDGASYLLRRASHL